MLSDIEIRGKNLCQVIYLKAPTVKMAPGAFSILAPFLGRKSKKYEKLETDDPERRRQEATQEEINRLNCKIVSKNMRPRIQNLIREF